VSSNKVSSKVRGVSEAGASNGDLRAFVSVFVGVFVSNLGLCFARSIERDRIVTAWKSVWAAASRALRLQNLTVVRQAPLDQQQVVKLREFPRRGSPNLGVVARRC